MFWTREKQTFTTTFITSATSSKFLKTEIDLSSTNSFIKNTKQKIGIEKIIGYQIEWLESCEFDELRGEWLFSLLVILDFPLHADMSATLRKLLRRLCTIRASLVIISNFLLFSFLFK